MRGALVLVGLIAGTGVAAAQYPPLATPPPAIDAAHVTWSTRVDAGAFDGPTAFVHGRGGTLIVVGASGEAADSAERFFARVTEQGKLLGITKFDVESNEYMVTSVTERYIRYASWGHGHLEPTCGRGREVKTWAPVITTVSHKGKRVSSKRLRRDFRSATRITSS